MKQRWGAYVQWRCTVKKRETGERKTEKRRMETGDRKDGCGNLVLVFFRKEVYFVFDALAYEVW